MKVRIAADPLHRIGGQFWPNNSLLTLDILGVEEEGKNRRRSPLSDRRVILAHEHILTFEKLDVDDEGKNRRRSPLSDWRLKFDLTIHL
jgi:hypothetical protein